MRFRLFIHLSLLAITFVPYVGRAQLQPLGTRFRVNTFTDDTQYDSAVAATPGGEFMVVWMSTQEGSDGIFGRRFDDDGSPLTSEFQINSYTEGYQNLPALAVGPSGAMMVVWREDVVVDSIRAQRYDSSGAASGTEFKVNSVDPTAYGMLVPAIAAGSTAGLVVWTHPPLSVAGRLLDSSGVPQGPQFTITTTTALRVSYPDVAVDPNGDFVVVWTRNDPGYESELLGRRVASNGTLLGTEFQVNEDLAGAEYEPAVVVQSSGDFVVVWNTYFGAYSNKIEGRRFDSIGTPLGDDFIVSSGGYMLDPDVAATPEGGFVVAWSEECGFYCYDDVFARRYASSGAALGGIVEVNGGDGGKQEKPAIAINGAGRLLVTWTDYESNIAYEELLGQIFATSVTTPICAGGGPAGNVKLKATKLGAPAGDESISAKGELPFPPDVPAAFDPAADGAQLLIEDTGNANAVLLELSHRTIAIAPGPGCGPDDGWSVNAAGTSFVYKNKSGKLPPSCADGSAGGLQLIKFKDLRAKRGFIKFKVKLKKASLPVSIVGPLRTSLVTGASAVASGAGECGVYDAASCTIGPTKLTCP